MVATIGAAGDFVSTHRHPGAGPEATLHGHNYRTWIDVAGVGTAHSGLLMPRAALDRAIRGLLARFDHQDISELSEGGLPAAECLARAAWQEAAQRLPRRAAPSRIEIRDETGAGARLDGQTVTYLQTGRFAAAHRAHAPRLSQAANQALYGSSNNPAGHGHNYVAEIESPLPVRVPAAVWAEFDHRNLSVDIPDLQGHNVVTETIAALLARRIPGASRVAVWETPDFCAIFTPGVDNQLLGRRYAFHAAHLVYDRQLSAAANRRLYGACAQPVAHGHAYAVEVLAGGPLDPITETAFDLGVLDRFAGGVVRSLDYAGLEAALPELEGCPPTSEAVTAALWKRIENSLGSNLLEITLYETPNRRCRLRRGDDG